MNIIIAGRGTGKTTLLIRDAAIHNRTIITWNKQRCDAIKRQAKAMKLDIPEPISMQRLIANDYSSVFLGMRPADCEVDDALDILLGLISQKSGGRLRVENVVINITDNETIWRKYNNEDIEARN